MDKKKKKRPIRRAGGQAWPMESDSLSCHPRQVKEFRRRTKELGLGGIQYRDDGTCVVDSQREFNRAARARGAHHRGEGYQA